MYFSTILSNLNSIKEAKKQGLKVSKYEITLAEIKKDFYKMREVYEISLKYLSAAECKQLESEIESYFLILNKLYCSKNSLNTAEQTELQSILNQTKFIRDSVSLTTLRKSQYKTLEADNN